MRKFYNPEIILYYFRIILRNTGYNLDPDPDWDFWPDSSSMNEDPKHWFWRINIPIQGRILNTFSELFLLVFDKVSILAWTVQVVCNNSSCPYSNFMHAECFEVWQESVLNFLKTCGRARFLFVPSVVIFCYFSVQIWYIIHIPVPYPFVRFQVARYGIYVALIHCENKKTAVCTSGRCTVLFLPVLVCFFLLVFNFLLRVLFRFYLPGTGSSVGIV